MFNFSKYFSSLSPTISVNDLDGAIKEIKKSLLEDTIPPYKAADSILNGKNLQAESKSEIVKRVEEFFRTAYKTKYQGNSVEKIYRILTANEKVLEAVIKVYENEKKSGLDKEYFKVLNLNIIAYLEKLDFSCKYSRYYLNTVLIDFKSTMRSKETLKDQPSFQLKFLDENLVEFFTCLRKIHSNY